MELDPWFSFELDGDLADGRPGSPETDQGWEVCQKMPNQPKFAKTICRLARLTL